MTSRKSHQTTAAHAADRGRRSPFAPLRRMRILALAVVAGSMLALPAVAHAEAKAPADPGVRCAAKLGPGEYEFYMPGAKVTDINGNKWVCGPDGQWFRDYSAIRVTLPPLVMTPVMGSAVLAP